MFPSELRHTRGGRFIRIQLDSRPTGVANRIERGKKRGSLTYEEINATFDNVDDVSPERRAIYRDLEKRYGAVEMERLLDMLEALIKTME